MAVIVRKVLTVNPHNEKVAIDLLKRFSASFSEISPSVRQTRILVRKDKTIDSLLRVMCEFELPNDALDSARDNSYNEEWLESWERDVEDISVERSSEIWTEIQEDDDGGRRE